MNYFAFNQYKVMPWKNGQGITYEVIIHPIHSSLQNLDFDFRISMAEVSSKNTFSTFNGYDRILTVLKGEGISFNKDKLLKHEIRSFKGNEAIESAPLVEDEKVLDLGIIYKSEKYNVTMKKIKSNEYSENQNYDFAFFIELQNFNTHFFIKNEEIKLASAEYMAILLQKK